MPPLSLSALPFALPALAVTLLAAAPLQAQEKVFVSLKDALQTEVQHRAFTLPKAARVHVKATGAGVEDRTFYAYGWILDAATREVVWQLDGRNAKAAGKLQHADQWLELKAGTYEAYYANPAFGWRVALSRGTRDIDRRRIRATAEGTERDRFGLKAIAGALAPGQLEDWRAEAVHYGLELSASAQDREGIATSAAPMPWKREVVALLATRDSGSWTAAFRATRPVKLHVYAQGERESGGVMADAAWILDARTRRVVWELDAGTSDYGGGAEKNRRKVEVLDLPAGDYIAGCSTDDSHSPDDWNSAPPADPLRYGLILSAARDTDQAALKVIPVPEPGPALVALTKLGNDRRDQVSFTLKAPGSVRVYALGEADDDEMADGAWITDASGRRVWTFTRQGSDHAGGARKNRVQNEVLKLAAGTYTLHVRTDGSHAYGDWNDAPPRDPEQWGAAVYAVQ
jgi:hypothetical protein